MTDPTVQNEQPQQTPHAPTGAKKSKPVMTKSEAISILRLAANRLNAKKSTGPKTKETKDRVRHNACRHGFTGQVLIMTVEEREAFDVFVAGVLSDFAPVGTYETFLANSIAEDSWRLNQIRARCSNLAAVGAFEGAGNNFDSLEGQNHQVEDAAVDAAIERDRAKELALLSLYMQRTQRACEKHKKELIELQQARKARREAELEEARLLFQLADTQGLTYDPKKDGFVFSLQFIKAHTERHHKLILAKRSESEYRRTRTAGKAA